MDERFKLEGSMSYRKDSLGNWITATDPAQPNPEYVPNPGIHGWMQGENGLVRIDIKPDEQVVVPSVSVESITPIQV